MKTLLASFLLCVACSAAYADDLAEAAKAFDAKSYDIAVRIYTRLADAGNPAAQFKLGEMVWYGEGVAPDLAKATELFRKSAAGGNAEAAAALNIIKQREVRAADIAYWTTRYDGADIVTAAKCQPPVIPAVSKKNGEIRDITAAMNVWRTCYNGYVEKMASVLPAGKAIPADIAALMNEQEYSQTTARLDKMYAAIGTEQNARAKATIDSYDRWLAATESFAAEHNKAIEINNASTKIETERLKVKTTDVYGR